MSELHKGPCYHDGPTCPAPTVKVSDPIRARLDGARLITNLPLEAGLYQAALRAVLAIVDSYQCLDDSDLVHAHDVRVVIRHVIAEHLGVTDEQA